MKGRSRLNVQRETLKNLTLDEKMRVRKFPFLI